MNRIVILLFSNTKVDFVASNIFLKYGFFCEWLTKFYIAVNRIFVVLTQLKKEETK